MADGPAAHFAVALERSGHLIYAPGQPAAFIGNDAMVAALVRVRAGSYTQEGDAADSVRALAQALGLHNPPSSTPHDPVAHLSFLLAGADPEGCDSLRQPAADQSENSDSVDEEALERAVDSILSGVSQAGKASLTLTHKGPSRQLETVGDVVQGWVQDGCEARGLGFRSQWIGPGPAGEGDIQWMTAHLDSVTLTRFPGYTDSSRQAAEGWERSLKTFETAGLPYGIQLKVPPDRVAELPALVRRLCLEHRPATIELHPLLRAEPARTPSFEAANFTHALHVTGPLARQFDCELRVNGTMLEERVCFCGSYEGELVLLPNGSVISHPRASPEYCNGCFARWHCAGPCNLQTDGVQQDTWCWTDRCHVIRELVKERVLGRIADAGGRIWTG